jgi:hypothetical protein
MAAPMRSTDFRSIVEPILNECFDGVYDQRADEWSRVFREQEGIPRNYHEEPVLYGFGAAPQLPDGTPVTYQQGGVLFLKRYVYKVYGLAFALTKVLVEDGDHIRIGQVYARHLAQSLVETKETLCANVLNNAFNGRPVRRRRRRGSEQRFAPDRQRHLQQPADDCSQPVPDLSGADADPDPSGCGQQRQEDPSGSPPTGGGSWQHLPGRSAAEVGSACR